MHLTPRAIQELLGLQPHSTCGVTRETFISSIELPPGVLPPGFQTPRRLGGVLYFMISAAEVVKLHRIRSDQMYHHYLGEPVEVLLVSESGAASQRVIGPDLAAGMRPQLLIPGGTFHTARLRPGSSSSGEGWALLGTSVWLRAEPEDVEMADTVALVARYPGLAPALRGFGLG